MSLSDASPAHGGPPPALFVVAVFTSAALIFSVQPMMAKLLLPLLGGTQAVWNVSLAFFQAALLVGYGYAHLLQKLSFRRQLAMHLIALMIAAIVLPLRITALMGEPRPDMPALWLVGALALSIGLPFAVLSATAPLIQAWRARAVDDGKEPYALYAASNLGSLIALLAYPIVIEPVLTLSVQRHAWTAGYAVFVVLIGLLALGLRRAPDMTPMQSAETAPPVTWRQRLLWLGLSALPSSLLLGTTAYLGADVASAPFLWVGPLALYLISFIIAFQVRPLISPHWALAAQSMLLPAALLLTPFPTHAALLQVGVHLAAFFLTALVAHQALVARRPAARRLTEFYLWLSLGGVLGGAFNAFVAPVIFPRVIEYPLVLLLAGLIRPWRQERLQNWEWGVFVTGVFAAMVAVVLAEPRGVKTEAAVSLVFVVAACTIMRRHALVYMILLVLLLVGAQSAGQRAEVENTWRSFFGVARVSSINVKGLGGEVRMLTHGTTLHGAQAQNPAYRCQPLLYYAPPTPIAQVFAAKGVQPRPLNVGVLGLGTGTVAAYNQVDDKMTFFEIDPLMIRLSSDPAGFTYVRECAKGQVDFKLGDARLTLNKEQPNSYDILLIDAFSSDAVPGHLLTVEAIRLYLSRLKPDGVLILHLSNRNLELDAPAQAAVEAAGGSALRQYYTPDPNAPPLSQTAEDVLIAARNPEALKVFRDDPRWSWPQAEKVRPWTDDYSNLFGAMIRRMKQRSNFFGQGD
ncbi:fused MFS/spermidine synthase [Caulobacter sp. NIBR2454]|uniref:fused MFS/spermidine synthase n=1 Tax=Caulobacter sp. NIBR2454 TaxID=3015996 RepID=UPI0022B64A40|nr:fused MFS/spermidine synthase [Caulobacter sp. NIBR2454]